MIDCGPHALYSLELLHADLSKITDLCVTHTHADHIDPAAVARLAALRKKPLRIWCDAGAVPVFSEIANVDIHPLRAGQERSIGECSVIPLSANHLVENTDEQPLQLSVGISGKRFFYGCDGAWIQAGSFLTLQQHRPLDLMIFECHGRQGGRGDSAGLPQFTGNAGVNASAFETVPNSIGTNKNYSFSYGDYPSSAA